MVVVDDLLVMFCCEGVMFDVVCNVLFYVDCGEMFVIVGELGLGKLVMLFVLMWFVEYGGGEIMSGWIVFWCCGGVLVDFVWVSVVMMCGICGVDIVMIF